MTRQNALCILFGACEGTSIRWVARRLQFQQVLEIRLVLRCFIWHDDMVRLPWFLVLTSLRYLLAIVAILVLGVASCSSPTWMDCYHGEIWRVYIIPNIPSNVPVGHLEAGSLCFPLHVFGSWSRIVFGSMSSHRTICLEENLSPKFFESRTSLF